MRAFIAITLPGEIKKKLGRVTSTLRQSNVQAKWVDASKLHITLKFLGDVEQEIIPSIVEVLQKVGSMNSPFVVKLSEFGFFPQRGKPRVFFVGTDQQERLKMLAMAIEENLVQLDFPKEGRFRSHITLARFKGSKNLNQLQNRIAAMVPNGSFKVASLVLYKSTLTSSGPLHEVLFEAPFKS